MERPYVDWVRVEDFRCVRDASLHLTPLHALIGPNDSGKSTLLTAIHENNTATSFWVSSSDCVFHAVTGVSLGRYPNRRPGDVSDAARKAVTEAIPGRRLLRLDPEELRRPTQLIPQGNAPWFQSERGLGLASLYDALLNRDRAAFTAIDVRFGQLFPTAKEFRLENVDERTKSVALTLRDGTEVGSRGMSEGMLYWLAFAVVKYVAPTSMLLIEEPENGLHPARIAEVMRVLRELSQHTQIVLSTHSPLVINELKPDEVTIVTRTAEQGTICTPMTATKNFAERSKVYALGELWLSYADGDLERELVDPNSEAAKAG